jgi:hypothetical protein
MMKKVVFDSVEEYCCKSSDLALSEIISVTPAPRLADFEPYVVSQGVQ